MASVVNPHRVGLIPEHPSKRGGRLGRHIHFDKPTKSGLVKVKGAVRGGHAFEILGVDAKAKTVLAVNSWGAGYGAAGRFTFSWKDLDRLPNEQGEAATAVV